MASWNGHVRAERGLTFLEIVFAVALLAILASTLLGAANFMLTRQKYEQRTRACMELANRLVLQFLDDRDSMPDPDQPLTYDGDEYRWSLDEDYLGFVPARTPPVAEGREAPTYDKFRIFRVKVWLAEQPGSGPVAAGPHCEISRMCDVQAIFRNPDSLQNMLGSEEGRQRLTDSSRTPLGLTNRKSPDRGQPGGGGRGTGVNRGGGS